MKRSMIVMVIMAVALSFGSGGQAQAAVTINFDNFPATATGTPYPLDFLADYGIPNITIGGDPGAGGPLIIDTTSYVGFIEPSPPNVFRQDHSTIQDNLPNWLEFHFSPELTSFSLTRIGFNSGRSMPRWEATFYDADGLLIDSFGEPYLCCNYAPQVFPVSAPSGKTIAKMRLTSWHTSSTFRNIGVDDFVLTYPDSDVDGFDDDLDNCPADANPDQSDIDGDEVGDICDSCPADVNDECNTNGSAAEEVSANGGGTVATPDGQLTIDIDPNVLAADTTISITQLTDPNPEPDLIVGTNSGKGQTIASYVLEPDGLTFTPPGATLTVVVDVTGLNAIQREKLDLYYFDDTAGAFVALEANCIEGQATDTYECTKQVEHFSNYAILAPLDSDEDGAPDEFDGQIDVCPDTEIPEALVPTSGSLRYNRWALMEIDGVADGIFDTNSPPGGGTSASFTIEDTAGCSCEQIVEELGLGKSHLKNGCSTSSMLLWIDEASNL